MNEQLRAVMREATRLTQTGRVYEATALIQQALRGDAPATDAASPNEPAEAQIIEGSYRVLDPRPAKAVPSEAAPQSAPQQPSERVPQLVPPTRARRQAPAAGQFLSSAYRAEAGTRDYKLYIPSGYHGQPLPLIVMLHGCTQSPDDFAAGTAMNRYAEERGFLVAYPAQATSANQAGCWNWFQPADQQRDQGEPALIAGITRQVMSSYHSDPQRVYVAGLSAGGAMAVILGATYPELYAAIGVHSGLPYGAAHDLSSALRAMRQPQAASSSKRAARHLVRPVPTIVFHGDQDSTVHPRNGEQVIAQAALGYKQQADSNEATAKLRMQIQREQAAGGRNYTRRIYRDAQGHTLLEQWLIHGAGHAWSGGSPSGSFSDSAGPNATQEMLRFFAQQGGAGEGQAF